MSSWIEKLANKGRKGGSGVLVQIAREVVGRKRSLNGAISEVRHPAVLDALSDEDFEILGELVAERVDSDREFAQVLARLTHAAAHAKGFERQTVDAALRLDSLLPSDDPAREREKLLRDAYNAARHSGYIQGGRRTLGRLGQRELVAGETYKAHNLLKQQLELGPATEDTIDEVDSAILLADLTLRDGDAEEAMELYSRAEESARRLGYKRGSVEALIRRLDAVGEGIDYDTRATLEEEILRLATDLHDESIIAPMIGRHARTLLTLNRYEDAIRHLEDGLEVAREMRDLELENACLAMLSDIEQRVGRLDEAVDRQRDLIAVSEQLGNMPAAAADAVHYGSNLLTLGRLDDARAVFERAIRLAEEVNDRTVAQRAYGGLGLTLSAMKHPMEALNNLMHALEIARATQDLAHEAQWLASIGETLWKYDQRDDALSTIQQALGAAQRVDDLDLQAGMHSLLGQIALADRNVRESVDQYHHALDLYRELGRQDEEINVLSQLGTMAMDVGRVNDAMALYSDALDIAAASGQRAAAVRLYGRLARLAQRQGDMNAALVALEHAVEIAEGIDQPALLNQALQHLAVAQDTADDPAFMDTYEQALRLARSIGDGYGEAMMLTNVGARMLAAGNHRDAAETLEYAIHLADAQGTAGERIGQRARMLVREARGGRAESRERVGPRGERTPSRSSAPQYTYEAQPEVEDSYA